jgi:hypothetical protein
MREPRPNTIRWLPCIEVPATPTRGSTVLAGQPLGIKEVDEGIWLVSFTDYDLGYIDLEQPVDNPFGPRLSPLSCRKRREPIHLPLDVIQTFIAVIGLAAAHQKGKCEPF